MATSRAAPVVWTGAAEAEVDFCVWVLLVDGLRAPPFDRHGDGTGELRSLGLSASSWEGWLRRVVEARAAFSEHVRSLADFATLTPDDRAGLADRLDRLRPVNAWTGAESIRSRLGELWAWYEPIGEAWQGEAAAAGPMGFDRRDMGRLWRVVDRERTAGPTLTTQIVRYPAPVVAILPPDTLILAPGPHPSSSGLTALLRDGVARLEGRASAVLAPPSE